MPSTKKPATKPNGKAKAKNKGGRPAFVIDFVKLKALAQIQCTDAEIAAVLGCSLPTFNRNKDKDPRVVETIEEGKASGRASLRRKQYAVALDGNPTMLIWLGKQLLGQRDKLGLEHSGKDGGPLEFLVKVDRDPGT